MPGGAFGRQRLGPGVGSNTRSRLLVGAFVSTITALLLFSCSGTRETPPTDDPAPVIVGTRLEGARSAEWVAFYDPNRASNGYTLALFERRIPMIIDMNGRIVHAWPEVRAKSRARLLPDGSLLTLGLDKTVSRWSWAGERIGHWELPGRIPHHDLIRTSSGNLLVITRTKGEPTDDLLELDDSGAVVWEWSSEEHLAPFLDRLSVSEGSDMTFANETQELDLTHVNSVQELPENRHFDAGDDRFRPGNLLISARNLDSIFVIDRQTGEVTWDYTEGLDYQHEALMVEPGQPGAGNILVFNNGYHNRYRYRSSEVFEIDPITAQRTWEYSSPTFYSSTGGLEQPLPNGNVLISSSLGGRVFEVTRDGDLVWQWTPIFEPRRPHRVPYDFTPQLAALERRQERMVRPEPGYRFVDRDAYRFGRRGDLQRIDFSGYSIQILNRRNLCKKVFLPVGSTLSADYGIHLARMREVGLTSAEATFRAWIEDSAGPHELIAERLWANVATGDVERKLEVDVSSYDYSSVELCFAVESPTARPPDDTPDFLFWRNPRVLPAGATPATPDTDDLEDLTRAELEARRDHLRALGYVD